MKKLIKNSLQSIGVNVSKYKPLSTTEGALFNWLVKNHINVVIDVGANTGQFALELLGKGYKNKIISFEPQDTAYEELKRNSSGFTNWTVAPRMAIGDKPGKINLHVSRNSVSSSIRDMLPDHLNSAPESEYVGKIEVDINMLDSVIMNCADLDQGYTFLKIDTQGYEWQVLQGAEKVLSKASGLLLELSVTPLYDGQVLYLELMNFLEAKGFRLYHLCPNFSNPETGQILQFDAIFVRNPRA